jgi:hypothetical protein
VILQELKILSPGVVFGSMSGNTSYLVPIYTNHDAYFVPGALVYYMPLDRIKETLLIGLHLDTKARMNPRTYLEAVLSSSEENHYKDVYSFWESYHSGLDVRSYRARAQNPDASLLEKRKVLLDEIEEEYRNRYAESRSVREALDQGGVKYILWDKILYPHWDVAALPGTKLIRESAGVALYALQ